MRKSRIFNSLAPERSSDGRADSAAWRITLRHLPNACQGPTPGTRKLRTGPAWALALRLRDATSEASADEDCRSLPGRSQVQDGQTRFSISDTGVGLPMEKMDQISSAFFTTKPQESGHGGWPSAVPLWSRMGVACRTRFLAGLASRTICSRSFLSAVADW